MSSYKIVLFILIYLFNATALIAKTPKYSNKQDPCRQVTIGVNPNWPPYYIDSATGAYGSGVEFSKHVFAALDLPYKFKKLNLKNNANDFLEFRNVDVVVSLYHDHGIQDLELLLPAYINDPLTILVKKNNVANFTNWQQLASKKGIIAGGQDLQEMILAKYADLKLTKMYSLDRILRSLNRGNYDYFLGSKNYLKYVKQHYVEYKDLTIANLQEPMNVYIAINRKSACYAYAPYLRNRLRNSEVDNFSINLTNKNIKQQIKP